MEKTVEKKVGLKNKMADNPPTIGPSKSSPPLSHDHKHTLPVIIAGAGPCGLVTALTCQNSGVPFVIYERAAADKLCSNAGSAFDMAPTAIKILENELGLTDGLDATIVPFDYMYNADMTGKHLHTYNIKDLGGDEKKITDSRSFGSASRSGLQLVLLDALGLKDEKGNVKEDPNGILRCGVAVKGYQNYQRDDDTGTDGFVQVQLSNGTTLKGSVLLACDGIHSGVRKHMYRNIEDPLNYCGQICWWGKTTVEQGSALDRELQRIDGKMQGNVAISLIGTSKKPGGFYSCEVSENVHAWAFTIEEKKVPGANTSNDLTRRGGTVLTGDDKRRDIDRAVSDSAAILRLFVDNTPDITRAGFFDRANLDLAYVDGRVALLGDAAHPQSPIMGQGANMAIVDGYVAATRLAAAMKKNDNFRIEQALMDYDSKKRRKDNNIVIKQGRKYGSWFVSHHWFTCWAMGKVTKYMPASALISFLVSGDKSNKNFVDAMKKDLE